MFLAIGTKFVRLIFYLEKCIPKNNFLNIVVKNDIITSLVTKEKGYDMDEYMARIKNNDVARMVKIADRVHNLSEAIYGSLAFKKKYVKETEAYFIDLAKDTVFETELNEVLEKIKEAVKAEDEIER